MRFFKQWLHLYLLVFLLHSIFVLTLTFFIGIGDMEELEPEYFGTV
jgi:hypothetical protein